MTSPHWARCGWPDRPLTFRSLRAMWPELPRTAKGWYDVAPVWLQEGALTAYGAWLQQLRYGGEHQRTLKGLHESQWWPWNVLEMWQLYHLQRVVAAAAADVPFYRKRASPFPDTLAHLARLPILTKEEVREAGERMISRKATGHFRRTVHTGGTTGTPLAIACDSGVLQRNYAFFARALEWAGIHPGDRVATFAGRLVVPSTQRRPPYWRQNHAGHALLCSSYHLAPETIPSYVDALARFHPALIDSYPSSLRPIAQHLLAHGDRRIRPRAIVTSSETLDDATRALFEEAFGCQVYDQYGSAEMAGFVSQCAAGRYHVNPEFGVVEVLRDGRPAAPGETGELVLTGFINPVMPFIRYATGDLAVQGGIGCACGRSFPTLTRILGRQDDVLVTPDGREVGRLDPVFKGITGIVEAQIVQDGADHVRMEVVTTEGWSARSGESLRLALAERLGPAMHIDIEERARIERGPGGKLRGVVNEWRRGPEWRAAGTS